MSPRQSLFIGSSVALVVMAMVYGSVWNPALGAQTNPACIQAGGIANPSIYGHSCCEGLSAILQNQGCPPGGCHYLCTRNPVVASSAKPLPCVRAGRIANPSIPGRSCCSGLRSVLQNPKCAPGGCHYLCKKK